MFDKLEDLLIRYEELMSELSEPDVANNPERFRKLMKEQSDILPIVEAYKEYKQCKQNIEDSLAMLEEESDEEMRELAKEELNDAKNRVAELEKELEEVKVGDEESDEVCELCGRRMVIKYGPHGRFLACPGFPECRNTKPYYEKIGVACPKCGKDIVLKKTQKGRKYYGCIGNPECDFMVWQKPSNEKCPVCGSILLEKGNKLVCSKEGCGFVKEKEKEENGQG